MKKWIMDTKLFWKLYFWWGIRQAMRERKRKEAEAAKREPMSNDDYWDMVHRKRQIKE
jgi:hypothetical protein